MNDPIPSDLLVLEAANLFVEMDRSEHLALVNVKLPNMEEIYIDHLAGGAYRQIEVPMQQAHLECTFVLAGWQPYILRLMTVQTVKWIPRAFMIYGVLRAKRVPETPLCVEVRIEGRIGRIENSEWSRGTLNMHQYSIRGITAYRLKIEDEVMHDWDFYTNKMQPEDYQPIIEV